MYKREWSFTQAGGQAGKPKMSIATKANNQMRQVTWSKLTNWFSSLIDIEFFCIENLPS